MKKAIIMLMMVLVTVTMSGFISSAQEEINYYPLTAIITNVDGNEITATSINGNKWQFLDDEEYYEKGDMVSLLMDDKGTDLVFDDEIVKVHYCGNVAEWKKIEVKNKIKKMVKWPFFL